MLTAGTEVIIKDFIMAAWGWQVYPPPKEPDAHVRIKHMTVGHIIELSPLTVDFVDERNVLCRVVVEDQYVHEKNPG